MKPVFKKVHAETYPEFKALAKGWKITFSYVYEAPGPVNLEFDLPEVEPGEQYLAFNLTEHGERGKRWLLEVGDIDIRAGCPSPHPVPYWDSFIGGIGSYDMAFSLTDARELVLKSRAEMRIIEKAFEKK